MHKCQCCQKPLHTYTQEAMLPGRPSRELAECRTSNCPRAWITLSPDELRTLTPEAVARYTQSRGTHTRAETAGVG